MGEKYWKGVSQEDARARNLLFSIIKGILQFNYDINKKYTINEITNIFYFKQRDCAYNLKLFFDEKGPGTYCISNKVKEKISKIIEEHYNVIDKLENGKIIFVKTFGRFRDEYKRKNGRNFDFSKLGLIYSEIKPIILILHWGLLPIIPEHLMINSRKIPEDDILDFYYHYHMLEMLLREVNGQGEVMSLNSDNNLEKEMEFSVYTRRWGHNDIYRIKRTIDGWYLSHIAINGECRKNGEGAIINNLNHDSVFFPEEGVKYAFERLWNEADETAMSIEELQVKVQHIADWISSVEKNLGESQPEWVKYY